jgi:hypothetical protein
LADRLDMLAVKLPDVAFPAKLKAPEVVSVGFCDVDTQRPVAVTAAPPLLEIVPPPEAVDEVIEETAVVAKVGIVAVVVKLTWGP